MPSWLQEKRQYRQLCYSKFLVIVTNMIIYLSKPPTWLKYLENNKILSCTIAFYKIFSHFLYRRYIFICPKIFIHSLMLLDILQILRKQYKPVIRTNKIRNIIHSHNKLHNLLVHLCKRCSICNVRKAKNKKNNMNTTYSCCTHYISLTMDSGFDMFLK